MAANKSDISGVSPGEYAKGVIEQVEALMPDVRAPPVLSVCALNGKCCLSLLERLLERSLSLVRLLRACACTCLFSDLRHIMDQFYSGGRS